MFLATTGLTEFWDTSDEIVALGPWVTRHDARDAWKALRIRYAPNPWDDRERLDAAAKYCDDFSDTLLDYLCSRLNQIHSTAWSSRYWRVILGHWVVRYVHAFHDRYVHIADTIRLYPSVRSRRLSSESYITPRDTLDFARLYREDFLNLQLYSQVLESVDIPSETRSFEHVRYDPVPSTAPAKKFAARVLGTITRSRRPVILLADISIDRRHLVELMTKTDLPLAPLVEDFWMERKQWTSNIELRKLLVSDSGLDAFGALLVQSLRYNLPQAFVEGYADIRKHALAKVVELPRAILSATGWFFNEPFKFLAAEAAENGARLLAWQHGGGYYMWRRGPQTMELKTVDRWLAWGKASSLPTAATLPNPRFHQLSKTDNSRNSSNKKGIVLVANEHPMYPYWLLSIPLGTQYDEYIRWRIGFINALGPLRKDLMVRLYPEDYGWSQRARTTECVPDVQFDDFSVGLIDRLKQVKLAVFDHPTTSFLEGLALNVPTVLYWNPKHWEAAADAMPYLKDLQDAEVLHDNPETAAAKVASAYEKPDLWWQSKHVQDARGRFMEEFASIDARWLDEWQSRLMAEIE